MPNVAINNLSETWNNAGTTFTGIKLNVTDTASASGSLLLDVQKGGTSQLVLNKSGNLGLGVTPSAGAVSSTFQSSLGVFVGNTEFNTGANAYFTGSDWKYIGTAAASRYSHAGGAHYWYTAGSGTAGNAVTWSERAIINNASFIINEVGADYDFRVEGDTDANLLFVDASTDRVGIGTNAPNVKLEVNSGNNTASTGSLRLQADTYANLEFYSSNANAANRNWRISSVYNAFGMFEILSSTTAGGSPTTSRLAIDSSGNLGLGVTPSAWATNYNALQFGLGTTRSSALFTNGVNDFWSVSNAFFNGTNFIYYATGAATAYNQANGGHNWRIAASGTAGTAITFTQAMTLDSSGNLGIGTTAPLMGLHFARSTGNYVFGGLDGNGNEFLIRGNLYYDITNARNQPITTGWQTQIALNNSSGFIKFHTSSSSVAAGSASTIVERLRLDASSFIINDVGADYDTRIEGDTDANLFFVDASTDRVGIGTNAPSNKFVVSNGGANGFEVNPIAGESSGVSLNGYNRSTVAYTPLTYIALSHYFQSGSSPANVFVIDSSGNALLGGTTSPTTGTKSLTITTGTAPTASPADTFTIYSSDVSAGNTTLSIYTEGTPVSNSTDNAVTRKIAVRINGTLYYLLADTDNS